ncbi:MAG: hypothetical protein R3F62_12325 [Planctomycetota bacterium]
MNGQAKTLIERMRAPRRPSAPAAARVVVASGRASGHLAELTADLALACAQLEEATALIELPHAGGATTATLAQRGLELPISGQLQLVSAGAGVPAVEALAGASVGLVVLEQRPQAVRSAYALVKRVVLHDPSAAERLAFLVCPAHRPAKAKELVRGLQDMVRRFLAVEVDDLELAGVGPASAERTLAVRLLARRVLGRCAEHSAQGSGVAVA